jgi:PAS domain S-box-containing protein
MKLQHKIAAAYIVTLGIAVTGTTIGLLVGRHYQQKALASWDAVLEEYTLLNQLQFKILHSRPTKQLLPFLQDPQGFDEAIAAFQGRLKEIETMLEKYQQLDTVDNQSAQQRSLFYDYPQTIADFSQKLNVFATTVESLRAEANQSNIAEQELINLTQSSEFLRFIEFPDQLVDLTSQTAQNLNRAEWELLQAEKFRAQIATTSLLISMAIAALAAISLSRAFAKRCGCNIARQQLAWEEERASNQQRLQESYIRLQIAMEVGNMGTWDWQPQTNQVAFNREWKAMLGYAEDEIGNSVAEWQNRVHPEDIESALAEIGQHIRGEVPIYEKEHRLRCKDGTYKWILARGQVIERDAQGQPLRFLGVHYDVSERKAAEIALRELSQQLKKAQEIAHLGHWSVDIASQKITWSEEVFRIFGLDPHQKEPSFEQYLGLLHPDDAQEFQDRMTKAVQGFAQDFDCRILRPDGEIRHINSHTELQYENGEVVQIFGTLIDITDRQEAENRVRESEGIWRILVDVTPAAVAMFDTQMRYLVANQAWYQEYGLENQEIIGRSHYEIFPDVPQSWKETHARCLTGVTERCEADFWPRADGSGDWICWEIRPWIDRHGNIGGLLMYTEKITKRKEAEIKLSELSQQLKKAQEVAHLGYWSFDIPSQKITWSEEVFRIFGLDPHQGEPTFEENLQLYHPGDRDFFLARIAEANQGIPQNFDARIVRPSGEIRYVNARIEVDLRDGFVVRMFGIIIDITDRKTEEALRASVAQTRALLEAIPDMMLRYNDSYIIVDCKPAKSQKPGFYIEADKETDISHRNPVSKSEEFLGKPIDEILPDFLAKQSIQAIDMALLTGKTQEIEYDLLMPDGMHSYEARFIQCAVDEVFCMIRDISDRKQAEAQLQSLLSRTQLLNYISTEIRNSLDLETILDRAVNAIFVELKVDICTFAWYRQELNPPIWEVHKEQKIPAINSWLGIYNIAEFPELFSRILEEQIYSCDFRVSEDTKLKKFCQESHINFYLSIPIQIGKQIGGFELGRISSDRPWQDDEIALLQSIGTQVAIAIQQAQLYQESQAKTQELQKAYHDLQATQIQLIQAEKMSSLGQLVAGVAHEINNPVSFIYGNLTPISDYTDDLLSLLQLYQECYPEPPEEINNLSADIDLNFLVEDLPRTIKSMKNGAERIRDIVKSLRTFSRLDEADLKAVNLHENIDSTLVILQNRFNGKSGKSPINVVKNYGNLPLFECYIGLLNQVLMNLLVNAIQAIEERQAIETNPEYTGQVTITTTMNSDQGVSISVKDNGIGMSPEVQAKIFNPFFTTKPVGQGTGMGLPTSYQIVTKNHQGELSFISVLGEGTEFIIQLPFR